jgi:hypothetical protein
MGSVAAGRSGDYSKMERRIPLRPFISASTPPLAAAQTPVELLNG